MRFERELPSSAEQVRISELREGSIYFRLTYYDREMLVPQLTPVVFVGRDLEPDDDGILYFQDYESYQSGIRYCWTEQKGAATFESFDASEGTDMFRYENALDELVRCLMRRGRDEIIQ